MQPRKNARRICFFILLPCLLFAALVCLGGGQRATREAAARQADFVLLLEGIDEHYEACLHVGDRVIDRQSRRILGTVSAVESEGASAEVFSEKWGAMIEAPVPGRLNLFLTVHREEAKDKDPVRLGEVYYFRTYGYIGEGRVVSLL